MKNITTSEHDSWGWHGIEQATDHLIEHYVTADQIRWPEAAQDEKYPVACKVADLEWHLNDLLITTYPRGLINEAPGSGSNYMLDKVIRMLIPLAALEAVTGYDCKPNLLFGTGEALYPKVLHKTMEFLN